MTKVRGRWTRGLIAAGAHIEIVHSSHAVMVSHPEAVIRITLEAARA